DHASDRSHSRARGPDRRFTGGDTATSVGLAPGEHKELTRMDLNKLTEKAQEAIVAAQREAEQRHNTQVEPEHLLLALVHQEAGVVPAVLDKLGISPATVRQRTEA